MFLRMYDRFECRSASKMCLYTRTVRGVVAKRSARTSIGRLIFRSTPSWTLLFRVPFTRFLMVKLTRYLNWRKLLGLSEGLRYSPKSGTSALHVFLINLSEISSLQQAIQSEKDKNPKEHAIYYSLIFYEQLRPGLRSRRLLIVWSRSISVNDISTYFLLFNIQGGW